MAALSSSDLKLISTYLSSRKVLIITESSVARPALRRLCGTFGVKTPNIFVADTIESAKEKFQAKKPEIVFSDAQLGANTAYDLYDCLKEAFPSRLETLFFMLTDSNSSATATRAADEDVDALITIPFAVEALETAFLTALSAKMMPTNYVRLIEGGKALLGAKRFPEALKAFRFARKAEAAPVLACYFEGVAHRLAGDAAQATACFEEGLKFSPKHVRCLNALFDLHVATGNHVAAYAVGTTLSKETTIDAARIPQLIRLSLATGHHEDILMYFEAFSRLPQEKADATLANTIASALVICGKQYLKHLNSKKALEAFQKAEDVSQRKPGVMKEIIVSLFAVDLPEPARLVLARAPDDVKAAKEIALAEFKAIARTGDDATVVQLGTGLLEKNINEPDVYQHVITRSIALKRRRSIIEELVARACGACPDRSEAFTRLLPATYADS